MIASVSSFKMYGWVLCDHVTSLVKSGLEKFFKTEQVTFKDNLLEIDLKNFLKLDNHSLNKMMISIIFYRNMFYLKFNGG